MYRTVGVELGLHCVRCNGDVPIGRVDDRATCGHCQTENPIAWREMLQVQIGGETIILEEALRGLSNGNTLRGSSKHGNVVMHLDDARCTCGEAFTEAQIKNVNRLRPSITCAKCKAITPARTPSDAAFGKAHPDVVYIIGEASGPIAATPLQGAVIACGGCGAKLELAGETGTCSHCGAQNHRPPGAGAIARRHRFSIVFRY